MPTRPSQGGSSGTWGTELNAWLDVAHDTDGTIKAGSVIATDVTADSTTLVGTGTTVQAVLEELDDAIVLKANDLVSVNLQTASYGLVLADAGKVVEMNVGSGNNLTVPLNATQAFSIGTIIEVFQVGAGQTTVVATGGVTIRSPGGKLKLTGQYSTAALRKRGTDEWVLAGDIAT